MFKKLLCLKGVLPGLFGGVALPLALLITSNLPVELQVIEFKMSIIACGMLFLTMPLLGAIVAHFTAEKAIRSQFLTAIFAPTVVIGVFLIRTNQTKAAIHEQAQEHVSNENKNIKSEYRILAEKKQPELLNTGEIPQ